MHFYKRIAAGSIWMAASVAALAGCDRGTGQPPTPAASTPTTEKAAGAVNSYAQNPSETERTKVDAALAEVDVEIAELQVRVDQESGAAKGEDQAKLDDLKARRGQLRSEYDQAKFDRLQADTKGLLDLIGQSIDHGANAAGDAMKATGDKIKSAGTD